MTITPEVRDDVLAEYNKNPQRFSPFRTATAVGIPIQDVLGIVEQSQESTSRSREQHGGYGRPEMQRYLIARRRAMTSGWDNSDPPIAEARANLEKGTHTMLHGRDGSWLLLYSVPLRKRTPRPGYFNVQEA